MVAPPADSIGSRADLTALDGRAELGGALVRSQIGAGRDGTSFVAVTPSRGVLELWRLHPGSLTAEVRRRLAALAALPHPALLPMQQLGPDPLQPVLLVGRGVLRWGELAALHDRSDRLRQQIVGLFDALALAHHWNLVHGQLGPDSIAVTEEGRMVLDLTGLDVRAARAPRPLPPELAHEPAHEPPSPAADVWALAQALRGLSAAIDLELEPLLGVDPERRPTARAAAVALAGDQATLVSARASAPAASDEPKIHGVPRQLGPYRLLEQIGIGGMGRVFRAEDVDGAELAIKVLLTSFAEDDEAVARFRREARVLARLQTPHVARFVAANEDRGFHYLVMEYARGVAADKLIKQRLKLDPDLALAVACDVARALAEVHALGLVHRDVKPANILVDLGTGGAPCVRLCDFGIARAALAEGQDQLTVEGRPGTPSYMSPEQVEGRPIDARSDVYALGCTLYAMLAGRPPFNGIPHYTMTAHVTEPPPPLREVEPSVPPQIAAVVMACLAKHPGDRPEDGAALLEALEQARRGACATDGSLPQPLGLQGEPRVYDFHWTLQATPHELWPHVSNTDRLNRAAGLDDVEWTHFPAEGTVRTEGRFRAAGMELRWKENPFEWVAPHRLGVVREYLAGPFEWLRSTVEMTPQPDGTTALRHRIEILPRGLLGRAAAGVEIGLRLRRSLERVYAHIDAACLGSRAAPPQPGSGDPFEDPVTVDTDLRAAIDARLAGVLARGADPLVVHALARDLGALPAPRLARIRPRRWASERGFAEDRVLDVFLLAASAGLLELSWDILCPTCRIPSSIEQSLRALESHGRCEVCAIDFELDMAGSVELVFRVHPALRPVDAGVYCIGGPAHSPHVLAQVRLAPNERFALAVALDEGRYGIAGRGLPQTWPFSVDAHARLSTWDLSLAAGFATSVPRSLAPGVQRIVLSNDLPHEVLVRLERLTARQDAVTAAEAAAHPRFRELFPEQVLAPGRLVAVSEVSLLFAQVADALERYQANEGAVHAELLQIAERLQRAAALEGGAVVRLQGDGVMAVFTDRAAAVRTALAFFEPRSAVALALHAGAARMTTIGGHLDYFGRTLHTAEHMGRAARPGEILVGEPLLASEELVALLRANTEPLGFLQVGATLVARVRPIDADATRTTGDAAPR